MGVVGSDLVPYLNQLEELPFVRSIAVQRVSARSEENYDAKLRITTAAGSHSFLVAEFKTHLSTPVARQLVGGIRSSKLPQVVFAPHIGRALGAELADAGINYLDRQGNCHFAIDGKIFFHVEGRPTARTAIAGKGLRAAGYYALFTYLAVPKLLDAPVRTASDAAGISRQAMFDMRRRLLEEGAVVRTRAGLRWVPKRRLEELQRWLIGYKTIVRPALFIGSYRTQDETPEALEQRVERVLSAEHCDWALGGTAAAFRLTKHYRGEKTVVHVDDPPATLTRTLRALPDSAGPLVLLSAFGNLDWNEGAKTVHPLLIYSELANSDDERAIEAAEGILREHVESLWEAGVD